MTTLQKYKTKNEELKELLIKNLPTKIKAGNEKHLSNIYEYQTVKALDKCKFINFNSDKQISFMVFDIDKYEDKGQRIHRILYHRMVLPVFYQRAYSCLLGFSEKLDT